jgi:hypothetical protein
MMSATAGCRAAEDQTSIARLSASMVETVSQVAPVAMALGYTIAH